MQFRGRVLDFSDDRGALLAQAYDVEALRDAGITKQARFVGPELHEQLGPEHFALALVDEVDGEMLVFKKFATLDRGNAVLSALYFLETGHQLPPDIQKMAAANICQALHSYGAEIPRDLYDIAGGAPAVESLVDVRGVTLPGDMPKQASTPEFTKVARALEDFKQTWHVMHPRDRRLHAKELVKAATAFGYDAEYLDNGYANRDYGDGLTMAVEARYRFLTKEEDRAAYEMLLHKRASLPPETFAEILTEMDESSGVYRAWDTHVPDPYLSVFLKQAEAGEDDGDTLLGQQGATITENRLRKLASSPDVLRENGIDEPIIKALQRNPAEAFASLPAPLQQILTSISH